MSTEERITDRVSDCCLAPVRVESSLDWHGPDEGAVTNFYLCTKCLKACEGLSLVEDEEP
jgi:hypothetical protein